MNVRASSPFVRMLPAERLALLIGLFLLAFSISIGNFYYGASDLALIVSFITYIVIIAFSIAYQRNDPGWFQPLVFYMIWSELVRTTLPQISLFIYGLEFHNAIS